MPESVTCPHCQTEAPEAAVFCPQCGARLRSAEGVAWSHPSYSVEQLRQRAWQRIFLFAVPALICGYLGSCGLSIFVRELPKHKPNTSISGYANLLILTIPFVGVAGLCLLGIISEIYRLWKDRAR